MDVKNAEGEARRQLCVIKAILISQTIIAVTAIVCYFVSAYLH
ncbi:hypothetical protein SDC9_167377 [bioreactor metagenome]|uniref:Uncharacterized protein n=1 Tax=bioreactor metagenome TaxID=1076179 RepID=A0A645FZM1_9ZZZZ